MAVMRKIRATPRRSRRSLLRMTASNTSSSRSTLPLSPAVRVPAGELLFISGQVAEPSLLTGDVQTQTRSVCRALASILAREGKTLEHVVRVGVFLADIADFATVNDVYREFFVEPYPARTTVAVRALPLGARVEMDAVAR
jgi:2-iminobutanoate/2-iminopropanoate deaminase